MCGICGKFVFDASSSVEPRLLNAMLSSMVHRGPDDHGIHVDGPVGLGHRRLAIIGLGNGHQPLSNEDGSIWITFNGEIYNYQQLRSDLIASGHKFKTDTDTEVIVHLYEEMGAHCVSKLRGMFAFGIWDARNQLLFLARDRLGIKPLYYHLSDTQITFASEIGAILADPTIERRVDLEMIDRFLSFHYMPGAETLLNGIHKLEPGHYLTVRPGQVNNQQYWNLRFGHSTLTLKDAEAELADLVAESVKLHMISDVPVGILLSGGLDSTAILSAATRESKEPLNTYTIGFDASGMEDERPYARLAAKHFGARHYETTISWREFQSFLPIFVRHMEEPVCEPPAVALYFVSKLASESVKVLLSGEGGDEAFAGYPNYLNLLWASRLKNGLSALNGVAHTTIKALAPSRVRKYADFFNGTIDNYYYSRTSGPYSLFNTSLKVMYTPDFADLIDKRRSLQPIKQLHANCESYDMVNRLLSVDTNSWLPDDLLVKADKITMANSVELRVPFLDHELMEFAASLPGEYKVRGFTTKYIARRVLRRNVPREILNRKKAGFPIPYDRWLMKEMKPWVREVLLDGSAFVSRYLRRPWVEALLSHNEESGSHSKEVFSLLVLELWHRQFAIGSTN